MVDLLDGEGACERGIEADGDRRLYRAEATGSVLPSGAGSACDAGMWAGDAIQAGLAAIDEELEGAGLAPLTPGERGVLACGRAQALGETERVEFGEGPAAALARGLLASAYVGREGLPAAVAALEAAFYRIKDDTLETCPDNQAVEGLLAAVEDFAGDVETAGEVAVERLRARWTPGENPWFDGGRREDEPCCVPGSSLPGWALAERSLSVGYVLGTVGSGVGLDARAVGVDGDPVGTAYDEPGFGFDLEPSSLARAFDEGVARIRAQAAEARALCERVRSAMPRPTSRAMRDTLGSIEMSFDRYDPVLAAHAVPCDIDYQLALPVPDGMLGVDYVHEYLRRLALENDLLARCDPDARTRLLDAWMPDWRGLVANLYEPVALAALRAMGAGAGFFATSARAVDEVAGQLGLDAEGCAYLREFARQHRRLLERAGAGPLAGALTQ